MPAEDWMTVQQKAGEKVAPIDFPGNFSPIEPPSFDFRLWSLRADFPSQGAP